MKVPESILVKPVLISGGHPVEIHDIGVSFECVSTSLGQNDIVSIVGDSTGIHVESQEYLFDVCVQTKYELEFRLVDFQCPASL